MEWKYAVEGREVIFVCGAAEPAVVGFETLIKKDKGDNFKDPDKVIKQTCTGPITATVSRNFEFKATGKFSDFKFENGPLIKGRFFPEMTVEEHNFALVEVCVDKDDDGWVGGSKTQILARSYLEELYSEQRFFRLPEWWDEWVLGEPEMLLKDDIYMLALDDYDCNTVRAFIDDDKNFVKAMGGAYHRFCLVDMTRPKKLRTMDINDERVLRGQIYAALEWLWEQVPKKHKLNLAFIPDRFVANLILRRSLSDPEPLLTEDNFVHFCKDVYHQAAVIKFMLKWINKIEHDELNAEFYEKEAIYAEERANAEAQAQLESRINRELEELKATDVDLYHQRLVEVNTQKRKKEEEAVKIAEEKAEQEKKEAEAAEEARQGAAEAQAKFEEEEERKAQDELNRLAVEDPEEYNSRMQEMLEMSKAKLEKDSENPLEKRYRMCLNRHEKRMAPSDVDWLRQPFT